ncbi:MAG: putative dienelactone hydrolase [Halieaceae bacterium]|jgi:predicted dienelactone hydrolase
MRSILTLLLLLLAPGTALAVHECGAVHEHVTEGENGCSQLRESDFFYGDMRADAPELATRGNYRVGVRTLHLFNPDQLDILNYSEATPNPRYDRPLTMEVWYPATLGEHERQITTYRDVLGHGSNNPDRPNLPFEFSGRATRNAQAVADGEPFPLVVVSHGYSGSRVIMTWLTENLASKGYVVVAIDHTDSTHADATAFSSTLVNRPRDINFAIDTMASENQTAASFLSGLVDVDKTAIIGYSMGGYGVLSAAGVGASAGAVNFPGGVPGGHLTTLQAGNPEYEAMLDKRIKVVIAFAPYGPPGAWDAEGIKNLTIPSLIVVGAQDQTTGLAASKWVFENAINSERHLLIYQSAIHEVAPNPAPPLANLYPREYAHYQEPAWDNRRLNNINQHFVTAFLGKYLLGDTERYSRYLNLSTVSNESPRTDREDPNYWRGFPNWTAIGMEWHRAMPDGEQSP